MKTMNWPSDLGDLLEHRLEPLLELAAELRAGDQRAEVERDEPLVLEALRDVAVDDALREPFDDRRLADAGLADEHGIVLRAAREHLHHAADLLVAADHRIELALARRVGEIARVALQRLILVLRGLIGDAMRAAHGLERLEQRVVRRPRAREQRACSRCPSSPRARAGGARSRRIRRRARLRFLLGRSKTWLSSRESVRLRVALLRDSARSRAATCSRSAATLDAELLEDGHDDALVLSQEGMEQVQVVDERVAESARLGLRFVERLGGLHRQPIRVDHRKNRSGCFAKGRSPGCTNQGQRRCRIPCACTAGWDADAAPNSRAPCRIGAMCRADSRDGPERRSAPGSWPGRFSVGAARDRPTRRRTSSSPTARRRRGARRCRSRTLPRVPSGGPCRPSNRRNPRTAT